MQALSQILQEHQDGRRDTPMGISQAAFKTARLFVTMFIAMAGTTPPHQPDIAVDRSQISHGASTGQDVQETESENEFARRDRVVRERTLLGFPHPAYLAGQHPWMMPISAMMLYGSQTVVVQLLSWGLLNRTFALDERIFTVDKAELAGLAMVVSGGLLRLWCYSEMGKMFTFQVTIRKVYNSTVTLVAIVSGLVSQELIHMRNYISQDHKLVTTGPYTYIRHPSYTGIFLLLLGTISPIMLQSTTNVIAVFNPVKPSQPIGVAIGLVLAGYFGRLMNERAELEEKLLEEHFPQEYLGYKKRTNKFIPFVW